MVRFSADGTVGIITARWSSVRLPGKMLADIGGKPLLQHVVDQVRQSMVDDVVVATTHDSPKIQTYCKENQISFTAGEEEDVVGRLYQAMEMVNASLVVRIWGDSPLISPVDIDKAITSFKERDKLRYYTLYTEGGEAIAVMPWHVLEDAWINIKEPKDREWIHKYLYQSHRSVSTNSILKEKRTVDTQEDLDRVRGIYGSQTCDRLGSVG